MMKKVTLKRTCNPKQGTKLLSILQKIEEKDCSTRVYKSFRYQIALAETEEKLPSAPDIFITKNFDTKRGIERFTFTVIGAFYIRYNRKVYKTHFQHTLKIRIKWKTKVFSPKKSEILT